MNETTTAAATEFEMPSFGFIAAFVEYIANFAKQLTTLVEKLFGGLKQTFATYEAVYTEVK